MKHDRSRGKTVLFGGNSGGAPFGDTWEWDGTGWMQAATTGPQNLSAPVMTYDTVHLQTVLFGGRGTAGAAGEVWEWAGAWRQALPSGMPPGRLGAHLAYDNARGVAVLFGGNRGLPNWENLNDTWEWSGHGWRRVVSTATDPPARNTGGMAYNSARDRIVLFGGASGIPKFADTWEWDGTKWTLAATTGPSARWGPSMAYDSARRKTVLFGGYQDAALAELWEYGGHSAVPRFTVSDVAMCLAVAGGLVACAPEDMARLNVDTASPGLKLNDAIRRARKVAGLEASP